MVLKKIKIIRKISRCCGFWEKSRFFLILGKISGRQGLLLSLRHHGSHRKLSGKWEGGGNPGNGNKSKQSSLTPSPEKFAGNDY
jgi:hypothetical protein